MLRPVSAEEAVSYVHSGDRVFVHAAALAALSLVALVRFHGALLSPRPLADELVYLEAFRAYAAGDSLYRPSPDGRGYYYPPTFARLGAAALAAAGPDRLLAALRFANLIGLVAALWIALRLTTLAVPAAFATGVIYLVLAPPALAHGFTSGNLSFAVVGSILVALFAWPRQPVGGGALLGASALVKPIAPVGLAVLALHRPAGGGRRHLLAGGVGLALFAAATLTTAHLGEYLEAGRALGDWPLRRSLSLYRWLRIAGLPVTPLVVAAAVAVATVLWARRAPRPPRTLAIAAIAGMTLAAPALWSHSLVLTWPLQAMAIDHAVRRRALAPSRSIRRYEPALVGLAALALQFADGIAGGLETSPAAAQLAGLGVPVFAPLALALALLGHGRTAAADLGRTPEAA